jgi:hypothetical protein
MGLIWFRATPDAALQAVADCGLAGLSALVLLPLSYDLVHLDEAFVAEANRVHEWRRRLWERMANITIPRWALSFTGITIVLLALGWYGSGPVRRPEALLKAGVVLVSVIGAGVFARGWREAVAAGLAWSMACMVALWATAVGVRATNASVAVVQIVTLGVFLSLYGIRRAGWFARTGEPPVLAQRRALEGADGQAFAGASALAALLPSLAVWPGSTARLIGLIAAVGAGVMLVPAASVGLEVLVPRHRSVEELYGKKRKPVR